MWASTKILLHRRVREKFRVYIFKNFTKFKCLDRVTHIINICGLYDYSQRSTLWMKLKLM
jgi:hypothetical protein